MADDAVPQNRWDKVVESGLTHFAQLAVAKQWFQNVVDWTEPGVIASLDALSNVPNGWIAQGKHIAKIGQALQFGFRALDVPAATDPTYRIDVWQKQFVGIPGYGLAQARRDAVDYGKYNSVHLFLPYDMKISATHYPCDDDDEVLKQQGFAGVSDVNAIFGTYRTLLWSMWKKLKPTDRQHVWIPPRCFLNAQSYFDFQGTRYATLADYTPDRQHNADEQNPLNARQQSRDAQFRYFDWDDDPFVLGSEEQSIYPRGDGGVPREYYESDKFDANMGVFAPDANEYYDLGLNKIDRNNPNMYNRWDVWGIGRPGWFQVADCDTIPVFAPSKWMIAPFRYVAQSALKRGMVQVLSDAHAFGVLRNMKVAKYFFAGSPDYDLYERSQAAKFDAITAEFEPNKTIDTIAKVTQAAAIGIGVIPSPPTVVAGLILGVIGKTAEAINKLATTGGGFPPKGSIRDDMLRPKPVFEKITLTGNPSYVGEGDPPQHSVPLPPGMTQAQRDLSATSSAVTTAAKPPPVVNKISKPSTGLTVSQVAPWLIGAAAIGVAGVVAWKVK